MCIATVYTEDAGRMEAIMQDVVSLDFQNQDMVLTSILGETKVLRGKIRHVDFLKHLVTVESDNSA